MLRFNRSLYFRAVLIAVFLILIARTAWLSDDCFITMRTVRNFVQGNGLVWNLGERVQVFTHPLWMFVLSGFFFVFRSPEFAFWGASILGTVIFLFALLWTGSRGGADASSVGSGVYVALIVLISSKAFVEYSTSGLENPLTHGLLGLGYAFHFRSEDPCKRLTRVAVCCGLMALNRLDSILLLAPALSTDAWAALRFGGVVPVARSLVIALTPLFVWEAFSIVYYGVPFPNTAYAKLSTGLPRSWYLAQGCQYLRVTAMVDTGTAVGVLLGMVAVWKSRAWGLGVAVLLHLAYVVWIGGDFMVGRFLSSVVALSAVAWSRTEGLPKSVVFGAAAALVGAGLYRPHSPLRAGLDYPGAASFPWELGHGVVDERAYYYAYTGLLSRHGVAGPEAHPWANQGRLGKTEEAVELPDGRKPVVAWKTIGFYGYYADPNLHVVDSFALSDALLARLPVVRDSNQRIGHFLREIPDGYLETLSSRKNMIVNPALAEFYDKLLVVISGPLFTRERWRAILQLNCGELQPLLDEYSAGAALEERPRAGN